MKNLAIFLVFLGFFVILGTCSMAQKGPNMFKSKIECLKAFEEGKYSFYFPKFFSTYKAVPLPDGKKRIKAPPRRIAIVETIARDGRRWVILDKETLLRWEKRDSSLVPYAIDTCGNKIYSFYFPEETERVDNSTPSPKVEEKVISTADTTAVSTITELKIQLKVPEERPSEEKEVIFQRDGSWTATKTVTTFLGTAVGVIIGGYGFQKETTNEVVSPGIKVQTGDGTFVYGPTKIKTELGKEFNPGAAIICGLASGVLTLLLNMFLF